MAEKRRSGSMVKTEVMEAEATWLQQLLKKAPMKEKNISRARQSSASIVPRMPS